MTPTIRRTFGAGTFGVTASPQSLGKPGAVYPAAIATDSDMIIAVDRQQTTLLLPLNAGATSMTVLDASGIVAYNLLSIDNEIVKTTGAPAGNVVPISRGFDGTIAALHGSGATVAGLIDAYHHNRLVAEVEAIEQALGPNLSNIAAVSQIISTAFDFPAQSPGGNLSVGNNVITLTPVPKGVNGSDQNHYLYISGGTGAPEAVLITGGTAVSGAPSGTLFLQCANAHSGAWTIRSATAGGAEAVSYTGQNGAIYFPAGTYTLNAPIVMTNGHLTILGAGRDVTIFSIPGSFPLSVNGVFQGTSTFPALPEFSRQQYTLSSFSIRFTQPDSTNPAAMIHYPYAIYLNNVGAVHIDNVTIEQAWNAVSLTHSAGGSIDHLWFSAYSVGLNVDTTPNNLAVDDLRSWIFGGTDNQNGAYAKNGNYIAVQLAQCDGFQMQNSLIYAGQFVRNLSAGSNQGSYRISNTVFDQIHGIVFNTGYTDITNCWIINYNDNSTGAASGVGIVLNGGMVSLINCFLNHVNSQYFFVQLNFPNAPQFGCNIFRVTGCNILESNPIDVPMFRCVGANTATNLLFFENNTIARSGGTVGQPILYVDKGTSTVALHFSGNKLAPMASGVCPLLTIMNDGPHQIFTGQMPAGWFVNYPSPFAQAITDANLGAVVASAGTIAPTSRTFSVSGAVAITTMTPPAGFRPGETITIIPAGAFTWTSGASAGNFVKSGTAVVGQAITCTLTAANTWATSY